MMEDAAKELAAKRIQSLIKIYNRIQPNKKKNETLKINNMGNYNVHIKYVVF